MLRTSVSFFLVSHGRHDTESSHACQLNTKNRADRTVFPSPVANGLSSEPSTNGGSALLLVLPLCGCMLVRKRPIPLSALSTRRRHRFLSTAGAHWAPCWCEMGGWERCRKGCGGSSVLWGFGVTLVTDCRNHIRAGEMMTTSML